MSYLHKLFGNARKRSRRVSAVAEFARQKVSRALVGLELQRCQNPVALLGGLDAIVTRRTVVYTVFADTDTPRGCLSVVFSPQPVLVLLTVIRNAWHCSLLLDCR